MKKINPNELCAKIGNFLYEYNKIHNSCVSHIGIDPNMSLSKINHILYLFERYYDIHPDQITLLKNRDVEEHLFFCKNSNKYYFDTTSIMESAAILEKDYNWWLEMITDKSVQELRFTDTSNNYTDKTFLDKQLEFSKQKSLKTWKNWKKMASSYLNIMKL